MINVFIGSFLSFIILIIIYLAFARFIAKPIAVYSWRFWFQKPFPDTTFPIFMLYPVACAISWVNNEKVYSLKTSYSFFKPYIVLNYEPHERERYLHVATVLFPVRLLSIMGAHLLASWFLLVIGLRLAVKSKLVKNFCKLIVGPIND